MENSCSCVFLMKIGKEEFMDDLLKKGIVYMNTTKYFRDHPNPEIGDPFEGALEVQDGEVIEWRKDIEKEKLYCMWNINNATPLECESLEYDDKTNNYYISYDLKKLQKFSDDISEYPCVIIIHNIDEFNRRIEDVCKKKGLILDRKIVKYYDENSKRPIKVSAFLKREKYSHQQEARYLVHLDNSEPYKIEIGNIEDIAVKYYTTNCRMKLETQNIQWIKKI